MASTNFKEWDPPLQNAQGDTAYSTETMRTGGAVLTALLPSAVFNKFAHQTAMFAAAFCTMLAQKSYTTSDENFNDLVAVLMNVRTNNDVKALIQTIAYATSINFDASIAGEFDLTLTGNVSSSTLNNVVAGQLLVFVITQDATGNRTFAWPANISNPGAIAPQAGVTSLQMFLVRGNGTTIVPASPMLWITASGVVITPLAAVVSISANGNVSSANQEIIELVNAAGAAITRNVFTAVGYRGYKVRVKKTDITHNLVNLQPAVAGQTIDGQSVVSIIKQNDSLSIISDGANWWIF